MDFILIRHGQTQANVKKIYAGPEEELSNQGREEILATKSRLSSYKFNQIVSSPYKRTQESSSIISDGKFEISIEPLIKEMSFGVLEGKSFEEVYKKDPQSIQAWIDDPFTNPPNGGESIKQAIRRAKEFLKKDYHFNPIFLTHDGFIRLCICSVLEDPNAFFKFSIKNASINYIKRENGRFTIEKING